MTRNKVIRETQILTSLRAALVASLPVSWSVGSSRSGSEPIDAIWTIESSDGSVTNLVVEVRQTLEPRDVPAVLRRINSVRASPGDAAVVAAPFLSPRSRELLAASGAGWFDMTGNMRLQVDSPALFLDRGGASRSPYTDADDRRLKSLKGPGAGRVVRALLDTATPLGVRRLAEVADVAPATSSRVLELLVREDLLDRDDDGRVTDVSKLSLLRRWTTDYGLTSTNQAVPVLAARGIEQVLTTLKVYDGRYAITAEAATRAYLPTGRAAVAPLSVLTLFVPNASTAAEQLALRPVDRGANVVLVEPFDDIVYRAASVKNRLRYAAPSQVVADLLTGPGRAPEEGMSLIEALTKMDDGWAR